MGLTTCADGQQSSPRLDRGIYAYIALVCALHHAPPVPSLLVLASLHRYLFGPKECASNLENLPETFSSHPLANRGLAD